MSSSWLARIQRDSHLISRAAGDADAARRGPVVLAKRVMRRSIVRAIFRGMGNR